MRKNYKIIIKIIFIFIINFLLYKYIGNLYLIRFNDFIKENNQIVIKNVVNNILKNNSINYNDNLFNVIYNKEHEIINIKFNMNEVNTYLSTYLSLIDNELSKINYNYLNDSYKTLKVNKETYFLVPLGIISNNPFLYNTGPKVILYYNFINTISLKIDVEVQNYGLNNSLTNIYLNVNIDQSVFKPILMKSSTFNYRFIISSQIISGRVSNYLGANLNLESGAISNN